MLHEVRAKVEKRCACCQTIGREIGRLRLDDPLVINGDKLRALTETQLRLALDTPEIIFARLGADQ